MKVKNNIISQPHKNCPYCDKGEYPYSMPDSKLKCSRDGCLFMFPCSLYNGKQGKNLTLKK